MPWYGLAAVQRYVYAILICEGPTGANIGHP